ncbi:MAG: hypothetical protein LWW85_10680 [Marinilabiliales bacterium]|nr:hypothetical protein [Marinilabiliales bacterium]
MKSLLLTIGLFLLTFSLSAQPDRWYFSLTMGGCLPLGNYGSMDPTVKDAGFARNGFALNLDATLPLSDNWGLKGMVTLNNNTVNRNSMGTLMENRMRSRITFAEKDRDYLDLTVNAEMTNSMLFGPVFSINFDRFAWDFQAMTGMTVTYLPNQMLTYNNPANNWEYVQRSTNSVHLSLGLLAGTAVRFKVMEKIQLKIGADFQHSSSTSKFEEVKITKQGTTVLTEQLNQGTSVIPKGVITATAGFVYYL